MDSRTSLIVLTVLLGLAVISAIVRLRAAAPVPLEAVVELVLKEGGPIENREDFGEIATLTLTVASGFLKEEGEFAPLGCQMDLLGSPAMIVAGDASETLVAIKKLESSCQRVGEAGLSAAGYVYDCTLRAPINGMKEAIGLRLFNRTGIAVAVVIPYQRASSGEIRFSRPVPADPEELDSKTRTGER